MLTSLFTTSQLFGMATAATAIGTGVSALSAYQGAKLQQATASYNAQVAQQTAAMEEDRQRRNDLRAMAAAQTAMASSGLLLDSGSNLAVLSDIAAQQAENQLQIRWGGQVKSADARNRASAYGQKAFGSLIGGGAKIGSGLLSANYEYSRNL